MRAMGNAAEEKEGLWEVHENPLLPHLLEAVLMQFVTRGRAVAIPLYQAVNG